MQPDETPWFMVPVTSQGVIMLRNPDGDGQSLLIFSSQFRCLDYGMTQMADLTMVRLLPQNLRQIVELLRKVENADVRHFVLDRCPRCSYALVVRTEPFQTPEEFRELFIHQKATELARQELYFEFAIYSAQNGNTQLALDVALETVGRVTLPIGKDTVGSMWQQKVSEIQNGFRSVINAPDKMFHLLIAVGRPSISNTTSTGRLVDWTILVESEPDFGNFGQVDLEVRRQDIGRIDGRQRPQHVGGPIHALPQVV